jgi:hypothetical protein
VLLTRLHIRQLNEFVNRLSPGQFALLGGLVAVSADTASFLADGTSAGLALGRGIAAALGTSAACALLARRHKRLHSVRRPLR